MYLLNLLASLKQIRRGMRNKPTVVNVKKKDLYAVDKKLNASRDNNDKLR